MDLLVGLVVVLAVVIVAAVARALLARPAGSAPEIKDAGRDAMTAAAGYRTIRIRGRRRPTADSVRNALAEIVLSRPVRVSSVRGRPAVPA